MRDVLARGERAGRARSIRSPSRWTSRPRWPPIASASCAHRAIVQAAAAYRRAGLPAPALQRFAAKIGPGEALLWPARCACRRGGPARARRASSWSSADAGAASGPQQARRDRARVVFPTAADFAGLVRYIEASGASEVALVNAPGDDLAGALRARGIDAYTLGPPRQIELFAA